MQRLNACTQVWKLVVQKSGLEVLALSVWKEAGRAGDMQKMNPGYRDAGSSRMCGEKGSEQAQDMPKPEEMTAKGALSMVAADLGCDASGARPLCMQQVGKPAQLQREAS